LNCLSTKIPTLNYAQINLLATRRLNLNLINSFKEKFTIPRQGIRKKHSKNENPKKKLRKRNTFLLLIQIQN